MPAYLMSHRQVSDEPPLPKSEYWYDIRLGMSISVATLTVSLRIDFFRTSLMTTIHSMQCRARA